VLLRAREEKAFGLIELVIAMVMLNVGILALVATFQSGALAIGRSAYNSNASSVADKTMEVYRALENKAIYLNAPVGGGADVSGYPNGSRTARRPGTRTITAIRRPSAASPTTTTRRPRTRRSG